MNCDEKRGLTVPRVDPVKFIDRSNGTIKGYAVNTFQGLIKNYNEDRVSIIMNITKPNFKGRWPRCSYFGVFDGHGGNKCSDFLKQNMHKYITENSHFPHQPIQALKFGFKKAENQFLCYADSQNPVERSGSCAIVILIIDEMCYIANVGDSRAILSANSGKHIYPISKDHKPDSESQKQRIYNAGGRIYQSSGRNKNGNIVLGPFRIEPGKLSVSRSFGDIEAKLPKYEGNPKVLIAKPEITYFEINHEEHDFIMLCSDGVYDKLSNEEVGQCFWDTHSHIKNDEEKYQFIGKVPSKIIEKSMENMSMDNLTALVIVLEDQGRLMLPSKKAKDKESAKRSSAHVQNNSQSRRISRTQQRKDVAVSHFNASRIIRPALDYANQNNDHNRQKEVKTKKQNIDYTEKLIKRKSTANIFSIQNQKGQPLHHASHSLNSSVSAKMLGGTKTFQKTKQKQSGDRVSINQLMQKKKSVEHLRKDKEPLWKMMTSKGSQLKEKFIRF